MSENIRFLSNKDEIELRNSFYSLYKSTPIPEKEQLQNLGLYMNRQTLSRVLFLHEMYKEIIDIHGIVIEFGVRWGQNLSLFSSFRGMYEPYNFTRKIVGFDTFEGFLELDAKDGNLHKVGDYDVTRNYEEYLKEILNYHEEESPLPHIQKYELVKGDVSITLPEYLQNHPETIIAFAYFDFDVYKPTREALEMILPYLTKGSIIAFDELNHPMFPGETIAVKEVLGLDKYKIHRSPLSPYMSYIKIGE